MLLGFATRLNRSGGNEWKASSGVMCLLKLRVSAPKKKEDPTE